MIAAPMPTYCALHCAARERALVTLAHTPGVSLDQLRAAVSGARPL